MKQFAYLFTVGSRIVWSGETANSLASRMATEPDEVRDLVMGFGQRAKPGWHIELPTGEFLFCTKDGTFDTTEHKG